jgi:hypothetical protein
MHPTKFRFIWPNGSRGKDFFKSANQKQELPVAAMFVNGLGRNEQSLVLSKRLLILSRSINKHGHHRQFLFLIGRFLKTSPLKPLGQMNRNLVGSIVHLAEGFQMRRLKCEK